MYLPKANLFTFAKQYLQYLQLVCMSSAVALYSILMFGFLMFGFLFLILDLAV